MRKILPFFCFLFLFISCNRERLVDARKSDKYYYSADRKQILYEIEPNRDDFRQLWKSFYENVSSDSQHFEVLSTYFAKDSKYVYYKYKKITEADYNTFRVDSVGTLARDKNHVFVLDYSFECSVVEGADPESYVYISNNNNQWAKDINYCYYFNRRIDADVTSFYVINNLLAADKHYIYFSPSKTHYVDSLISYNLSGVLKAISSFVVYDDNKLYCVFSTRYQDRYKMELFPYKDINALRFHSADSLVFSVDSCVYWYGNPITDFVDIATFKVIQKKYAKDANSVFYKGQKIEGANPLSFNVLKDDSYYDYGVDDKYVYHIGEKLENSDAPTFHFINDVYAKDKMQVYVFGKIIKGANPQFFEIINGNHYLSKDNRKVYLDDKEVVNANPASFRLKKGSHSVYTDGKKEWKWSPGGNGNRSMTLIE